MKDIRIRLLLQGSLSNTYMFDVTNDKFGVLGYNLYGATSGIPFATSNMGRKAVAKLPHTLHDYRNVQDLASHLLVAIEAGYYSVTTVVFQIDLDKQKEMPQTIMREKL